MFFLYLIASILILGAITVTVIFIGTAIECIYDAFPIYSWEDIRDILFGVFLLDLGVAIGYITVGMFYAIFIYH